MMQQGQLTHTDLGVLQGTRIDDYWNVDLNRHLSDTWRGFTKFTLLKEKPPKGYMWSGKETDKNSHDHQTRSCMARSVDKERKSISETREEQEWAEEKPTGPTMLED